MSETVRDVVPRDRPPVLAVLPHFGDPEPTLGVLWALLANDYPELSVVVVDNSGNLAARDDVPAGVEIAAPDTNVGYCAAINLGLGRAVAAGIPFVLTVNNDTQAPASAIAKLVDVLVADDSVAVAGPLLTTGGGRHVWSAGSDLRFGPNEVRHRAAGTVIERAPQRPSCVDFVPGAFALYRTADLHAVGGLDEAYFMYHEDVDLGIRLRERGRRQLYVPWVRVEHAGTASSGGGVTALRKFLMGVNTPRFLRRRRSLRLWLSFVLFDVLGLVPALIVHALDGPRRRAQWAKGRGIVLGLTGYRASAADVRFYSDRA